MEGFNDGRFIARKELCRGLCNYNINQTGAERNFRQVADYSMPMFRKKW